MIINKRVFFLILLFITNFSYAAQITISTQKYSNGSFSVEQGRNVTYPDTRSCQKAYEMLCIKYTGSLYHYLISKVKEHFNYDLKNANSYLVKKYLQKNFGIDAYVKINGNDIVVPLNIEFSMWQGPHFGPASICLQKNDCGDKPKMEKLYKNAFSQHGKTNDWNIELAFVDKNGNWDSRGGKNYHVYFFGD